MDEKEKHERFTQLRTMIPNEVYLELTDLAKERETFTGAWDYGNVIKELLWYYRVFVNLNVRVDEIEAKVNSLGLMMSNKVMEAEHKPEDKKKEKYEFLGRRPRGEQDEN